MHTQHMNKSAIFQPNAMKYCGDFDNPKLKLLEILGSIRQLLVSINKLDLGNMRSAMRAYFLPIT